MSNISLTLNCQTRWKTSSCTENKCDTGYKFPQFAQLNITSCFIWTLPEFLSTQRVMIVEAVYRVSELDLKTTLTQGMVQRYTRRPPGEIYPGPEFLMQFCVYLLILFTLTISLFTVQFLFSCFSPAAYFESSVPGFAFLYVLYLLFCYFLVTDFLVSLFRVLCIVIVLYRNGC